MFELQHIICAVDFSSHSEGVLQTGNLLGQAFDARLSVFHAVTASRDRFPGTTIFERGGQQAELLAAAGQRLEALAAPLGNAETITAAGDPVETLCNYLQKWPADLAIAARRGLGGIQRVLLGSVVERMARRLSVPLLVVGPDNPGDADRPPFRKLVAACDAVDALSPVLAAAMAVAHRFGSVLHLLHAMELPVRPEMLEPTDGPYGEVQTALQHRLRRNLAKLSAMSAAALKVEVDILPGPAVEILPSYIRKHSADLLVVGVRPRRRLQQWLIGSTTEAALRHAPCTVLTVPATIKR